MLGPIVCGFLATYEWRYGFAAAGVGMLAGLVQYRLMDRHLGAAGVAPVAAVSPVFRARAWVIILAVVAAAFVLLWAGAAGLVEFDALWLARGTTAALAVGTLAYFSYLFVAGRLTSLERRRVLVILVLVMASAVFWSGYEQFGSSLNLFADRYTIRDFGSFEIPTSWFQSLNSLFLILLAPFFSMFWLWLARRHLEPSAPAKFAFGLILLGLGFVVMMGAATFVAAGQQVLPTWLVFTYLLHTMGELALSPVGLSAMTTLAPRRFSGQMMGMWFLCMALGSAAAGLIAGSFDTEALETWPSQYGHIVWITVGCGACCCCSRSRCVVSSLRTVTTDERQRAAAAADRQSDGARSRIVGVAGGRQRVPRSVRRAHRRCIDSGRRDLDGRAAPLAQLEHPREQHGADDRIGWRVARGRRDLHDPGARFARLLGGIRLLVGQRHRGPRRLARRAVHDPAAAHLDRRSAARVSRRHRDCRGVEGR